MTKENKGINVRVITPATFEGVMGVAILTEMLSDEVSLEVNYERSLDFRDYNRFDGVDVCLVLGLAYNGYALPQDFFIKNDIPFEDFIHISTYGEEVKGEHIVSTVVDGQDPIKTLSSIFIQTPDTVLLSKYIKYSSKIEHMINAVNDYRTWNWEDNNTTKMLLALYNATYKMLPRLIKGKELTDIVKEFAPIIKGQMEKMEELLRRKVELSKTYDVTVEGEQIILRVAFSEEYINEVAHALLDINTHKPVVACVGRLTKGKDIFSIRTSKIDASKIAYLINEGGGKEEVASVFSSIGYTELMGDSISTAIKDKRW